eukprot:gene4001-14080_t
MASRFAEAVQQDLPSWQLSELTRMTVGLVKLAASENDPRQIPPACMQAMINHMHQQLFNLYHGDADTGTGIGAGASRHTADWEGRISAPPLQSQQDGEGGISAPPLQSQPNGCEGHLPTPPLQSQPDGWEGHLPTPPLQLQPDGGEGHLPTPPLQSQQGGEGEQPASSPQLQNPGSPPPHLPDMSNHVYTYNPSTCLANMAWLHLKLGQEHALDGRLVKLVFALAKDNIAYLDVPTLHLLTKAALAPVQHSIDGDGYLHTAPAPALAPAHSTSTPADITRGGGQGADGGYGSVDVILLEAIMDRYMELGSGVELQHLAKHVYMKLGSGVELQHLVTHVCALSRLYPDNISRISGSKWSSKELQAMVRVVISRLGEAPLPTMIPRGSLPTEITTGSSLSRWPHPAGQHQHSLGRTPPCRTPLLPDKPPPPGHSTRAPPRPTSPPFRTTPTATTPARACHPPLPPPLEGPCQGWRPEPDPAGQTHDSLASNDPGPYPPRRHPVGLNTTAQPAAPVPPPGPDHRFQATRPRPHPRRPDPDPPPARTPWPHLAGRQSLTPGRLPTPGSTPPAAPAAHPGRTKPQPPAAPWPTPSHPRGPQPPGLNRARTPGPPPWPPTPPGRTQAHPPCRTTRPSPWRAPRPVNPTPGPHPPPLSRIPGAPRNLTPSPHPVSSPCLTESHTTDVARRMTAPEFSSPLDPQPQAAVYAGFSDTASPTQPNPRSMGMSVRGEDQAGHGGAWDSSSSTQPDPQSMSMGVRVDLLARVAKATSMLGLVSHEEPWIAASLAAAALKLKIQDMDARKLTLLAKGYATIMVRLLDKHAHTGDPHPEQYKDNSHPEHYKDYFNPELYKHYPHPRHEPHPNQNTHPGLDEDSESFPWSMGEGEESGMVKIRPLVFSPSPQADHAARLLHKLYSE